MAAHTLGSRVTREAAPAEVVGARPPMLPAPKEKGAVPSAAEEGAAPNSEVPSAADPCAALTML